MSQSAGTVSVAGAGRCAKTVTKFDVQGRAYESDVFSVDPTTGASNAANYLATCIYHDGRGDVVATQAPGGLVTTTAYDGAGATLHSPATRARPPARSAP